MPPKLEEKVTKLFKMNFIRVNSEKIFLNKIGINIENKKFSLCFYDFLTNLLNKNMLKNTLIIIALMCCLTTMASNTFKIHCCII